MLSHSEIASIAMTANGITAMNFPITPETKNMGANAMIVVVTEAVTLGMTSTVPSMAAWTNDFFICMCA